MTALSSALSRAWRLERVLAGLPDLIGAGAVRVVHVPHPHPQAEIERLVCDAEKAQRVLGWRAVTSLAEGVRRTRDWLAAATPGDPEQRRA